MRYFSFLLGFLFLGIFGPPIGGLSNVSAQNATLYFVPTSSAVSPGQTFRVQVMVDTKGEFVNAVAAYFMYPADKLDALAVDRIGSAMTLFAEDKATGGRVDISGGTPTPGFAGIQKIASVDFRVKPAVTGTANLSFLSDAAVLRNSDNQNILSLGNSGMAAFQIGQTAPPPAGGPVQTPTTTPTPTSAPTPTSPPAGGSQEALVIFDITIKPEENSNGNNAIVSWKTNHPANSQVYYGINSEHEFSVLDGNFTTEHSVVLTGVSPSAGGVGYSFQILGFDEFGGKVQGEVEEYIGAPDSPIVPPKVQNEEIETGGFKISFPLIIALALLFILVVVLIAWVLFFRTKRGA